MLIKLIVLAAILSGFTVVAYAAPQVVIDPNSGVITLSNNGPPEYASIGIELRYNPTGTSQPDILIGAIAAKAGKQLVASFPSSGVLRAGLLGFNSMMIGDGEIAVIRLSGKTSAVPGTHSILCRIAASTADGSEVDLYNATLDFSLK
jgi:hypothetical protein